MEHYCENCRWFSLDTFEDGFMESWCNRYPPMVYVGPPVSEMGLDEVPSVMRYWEPPTVGIRHCCGEWTPREDDPQEDTAHFPAWGSGDVYLVDCANTPKHMATAEVHDATSDLYQRNLEARDKALLEALGNALAALDYECGNCGYRSECTSPDCIAADRIRSMLREFGIEMGR